MSTPVPDSEEHTVSAPGFNQWARRTNGRKLFNLPPNWPAPPPGWTWRPGWTPDPTWGPPPAGWQLWIPDPAPVGAWTDEPGKELRAIVRRMPVWARLVALGAVFVLLMFAISAIHGSTSTPSALSIVQSDGYNASFQDDTASIAPSYPAGEVVTAADGLDSNGDGEACFVLSPSSPMNTFEALVLANMQETYPDATGSVSGNVVRVNIPAEDSPSL